MTQQTTIPPHTQSHQYIEQELIKYLRAYLTHPETNEILYMLLNHLTPFFTKKDFQEKEFLKDLEIKLEASLNQLKFLLKNYR